MLDHLGAGREGYLCLRVATELYGWPDTISIGQGLGDLQSVDLPIMQRELNRSAMAA
jgi:hypothetical protein